MLQWLADNKDLLIAVFGAGGAGAVLLAALLARKGSDGGAKTPGVTATVSGSGVAAAHGGTGDIDVRVNETVGSEAMDGLQQRLGLSLAETARLLKAFGAAGLGLKEGEAAVARISAEARTRDALVLALRGNDAPRAAAILAGAAAGGASGQPAETGPAAG